MSAEPAGPAAAGPSPAGGWAWPSDEALARAVRVSAAVAAAVLAGTGTGSATVAAVLLGVAAADRRTGAAALLAVLAAGVRWRTDAFDDLAGIQGVLGLAGEVGPTTGAASAWVAAAAVLLAVGPLAATGGRWLRLLPALPAGLLAAALVAGPGPEALGVRLGAGAAGVVVAGALAAVDVRYDRSGPSAGAGPRARLVTARRWVAVLAGAAAVLLAGWPA